MQEENNVQMTKELETLRRELRINRIFSAAACVLMLCILIGGAVLWNKVERYADAAAPLMEQLSKVDYEQLNAAVKKLDTTLSSVDWEELSAQLKAVDVEALNEAIEGLDTEELTEALENINEAVNGLKNFTGKLWGK